MIPTTWILLGATACLAVLPEQTQSERPPDVATIGKGVIGFGLEPALYAKANLLLRVNVQREIELSAEQLERIQQLQNKTEPVAETRARMAEIARLTKEARDRGDAEGLRALVAAYDADLDRRRNQRDEMLTKVLSRAQSRRLAEIQLQAESFMAFLRPEFQLRLNLDPDQVELIHRIVADGQAAARRASLVPDSISIESLRAEVRKSTDSKAPRGEASKLRERVLDARRETMRAIGKVLTKGQRANYTKWLGQPFDFAKNPPAEAPATPPDRAKP